MTNDILAGIDNLRTFPNEAELSNFLYDILRPYDKHFTFSPMVIDMDMKYDQEYFSKWIKTKILDSNIGLIKFNEFPDFSLTQQYRQRTLYDIPIRKRKWLCKTILESFHKVKRYENIVFDLRKNNGGDDWVAVLMMSFIFGRREHVNTNVFKNERRKQYTLSPKELKEFCECDDIPLLNNKNIFILISKNTFSAAELFTYTLQTFQKAIVIGVQKEKSVNMRAEVIGETTGGGANGGSDFRLNEHMNLFVPYFYCENPITKDNWEGRGVTPDIYL
jgi:C-terminal processing protease CtpA/Prc